MAKKCSGFCMPPGSYAYTFLQGFVCVHYSILKSYYLYHEDCFDINLKIDGEKAIDVDENLFGFSKTNTCNNSFKKVLVCE
jgi:hypothetical protein